MKKRYPGISPSGKSTGGVINVGRRVGLVHHLVGLHGKRVVDLGCGPGDYIDSLLAYTPHVRGVEWSPEAVALYRERGSGPEVVEQGDVQALRFSDGSFDVAILNEVLEHVPDDRAALREARRILTQHGHLVVFSPNRWYPFETHGVQLRGRDLRLPKATPGVPYVPLVVGQKIFRYVARNYWPRELVQMVVGAGFVIETHGFVWQTFENLSGDSPGFIQSAAPILRRVAFRLERIPLVRRLGVSQFVVARPTVGSELGLAG